MEAVSISMTQMRSGTWLIKVTIMNTLITMEWVTRASGAKSELLIMNEIAVWLGLKEKKYTMATSAMQAMDWSLQNTRFLE
eukprot:10102416-Heterocapsa_arctica.AAC.1